MQPFRRPESVLIVIYTAGGEFLLLERRKPPGFWQSVTGSLEWGETIDAAASRELKEETGYDVFKVLAVSPPIYSSAGMTDESVILVFVACTGNPTNTGAEAHEDIEILTLDCEQLARLLRRKKLKFGAKSWPLMMAFAYKGCAFLDPFQGY